MKKTVLVVFLSLASCAVTKKIETNYKSNSQLIEFYKSKGIEHFLVLKNYNSLLNLNKVDKISMPQNIVFDPNGYEIEHFDDKLCVNHTLEFLKKYNENTKIKLNDYQIGDYISQFKSIDNDVNIEEIVKSKKIRVFVNTATYADKYGANQEAFEIYNQFKDKYEVYIINLDYNDEWKDKVQ